MKRRRNVMRDREQVGYPPDLPKMLAALPTVVPTAESMTVEVEACNSVVSLFYSTGLYMHLPDKELDSRDKEVLLNTLGLWAAALNRYIREVTVINGAWLSSQGAEFSLETFEDQVIPYRPGFLVVTNPPKWDEENSIAKLIDRTLWDRRQPMYATIIVGPLDKYPHTRTIITDAIKPEHDISAFDPTTGNFRRLTTEKASKRR